jgi:hypothetical protein
MSFLREGEDMWTHISFGFRAVRAEGLELYIMPRLDEIGRRYAAEQKLV